jgi:hypothetical protein
MLSCAALVLPVCESVAIHDGTCLAATVGNCLHHCQAARCIWQAAPVGSKPVTRPSPKVMKAPSLVFIVQGYT